MRIIVVGAGIGGLAAAIGLRRAGHDVSLLERAPRLGGIGAGLVLFQNAMRALGRLGVREAIAAQGARGQGGLVLTSDGRELTSMPADVLEGTVAIHRGELQATLAQAAGDVRLGAEVTSVEQRDEGVVATIADGTEEKADLLVSADGLNSIVRGVVTDSRLRFAGYTAWRGGLSRPGRDGADERVVGDRRTIRAHRHRTLAYVLVRDQPSSRASF
jgi:2-polyprenyl-6-methoxyphenol hydroxylase-like FAD-dependent oxidoreductase